MSLNQHLIVRDHCEASLVSWPFHRPVVPNWVPVDFFHAARRMVARSKGQFHYENPVRVDVSSWQGDVHRSNQECLFPMLPCAPFHHCCKRKDWFLRLEFRNSMWVRHVTTETPNSGVPRVSPAMGPPIHPAPGFVDYTKLWLYSIYSKIKDVEADTATCGILFKDIKQIIQMCLAFLGEVQIMSNFCGTYYEDIPLIHSWATKPFDETTNRFFILVF